MKNKLTYLALFSIVGLASAAAAETTGLVTNSAATYAVPFALFVGSLVIMTLAQDYNRSLRPFRIAADARPRHANPLAA